MTSETNTKRRKPTFMRTDAHKKKRLGSGWRRPKGLQNKRRLSKKGYAPTVGVGYKNSKVAKGKTRSGKNIVMIINKTSIKTLNQKTDVVIVSGKLGNKKRLELLEEVQKTGFEVINLNTKKKIDEIKADLEVRKKKRSTLISDKESKIKAEKEKAKKNIEEKVKEEEKTSDDDKKEQDTLRNGVSGVPKDKLLSKKEKDKILTKKQ